MPRLIKSLGTIEIKASSFALKELVREELISAQAWNPTLIHSKYNRLFYFQAPEHKEPLWTIEIMPNGFKATSKEPYIWLRRGFKIFMGRARIEIE